MVTVNNNSGDANVAVRISSPSATSVTFSLGDLTLKGLLSDPEGTENPVASFRNLKYAEIPDRWHQAVALDLEAQKGIRDATQWGPRSPQTVDMMHVELTSHLYPRMSAQDPTSEFECLNLNVCTPLEAMETAKAASPATAKLLLPVLVWIHGGSFEWGDGGSECDGQYLVSHSIKTHQPVLAVSINYRLGMLGFFTSGELRQEARERGEAGFSNLGFHDQRLALQWVQRNIHHFGGDASRITIAGESAGAVSILAHLRAKTPVANFAMLLSPATIEPRSFSDTQVTFDTACKTLGLSGQGVSDADKIVALRELTVDKLLELGSNRLQITLCEDPIFFDHWGGGRFEEVASFPDWIRRVMVGQLSEEMALMIYHFKKSPAAELRALWQSLYPDPNYAVEVLSVYGVDAGQDLHGAGEHESLRIAQAMVEYFNDCIFDKAVHSIAEEHTHHAPKRRKDNQVRHQVYQYRFDQPDTIAPGEPCRGHAYHSFDNPFFFHFPTVSGPSAPSELRTAANAFAGATLRLAHGKEPWTELDSSNPKMASISRHGLQVENKEKRRWEALADIPDRLKQFLLGRNLLFGPPIDT